MAPKAKRARGGASSSSAPPPFDLTRFVDKKAEEKYGDYLKKNKNFVQERGMEWEGRTMCPITEEIIRRKWEVFCREPRPGVIAVVREFYANWKSRPDDDMVFVRGKQVRYDARTINSVFELTPLEDLGVEDGYHTLINDHCDCMEILRVIAREGAEWKFSGGAATSFAKSDLFEDPNTWLYFVAARMLPSGYHSDVTLKRAVMIYCLEMKMEVDVGQVILSSMRYAMRETTTIGLPFPGLVTSLCERAGVRWDALEELYPPKGPIKLGRPRREVFSNQIDRDRRERAVERTAARRALEAAAAEADADMETSPPRLSTDERLERIESRLDRQQQMIEEQQRMLAEHFQRQASFMDFVTESLRHLHPGTSQTGPSTSAPHFWPPPDDTAGDDH